VAASEPGFSLRSLTFSVYLPSFLFAIGQGAVLPVIPLFAKDLGATAAAASLVFAMRGIGTMALDLPGGVAPEAAEVLALSMLLDKGLSGTIVNFRRGEFEYTKDKAAFRKRLRLTAALCASLLVLAGADFYVRYRGLTSELEAYRQSLRASYQELFPGEKNVADPVYQLEAKLKAVEKEAAALGSGGRSLDVLKSVAVAVPDGMGVKIDEFSIADGRITAKGEAQTFNGANSVKESLQKAGFTDVAMGETRAKPGGRTSFSINAQLR